MSRDSLPTETARFIMERIESVEQMEILLLLASRPGEWSADLVAKEMRSSPRSVGRWLENLKTQRLLVSSINSPTSYRFEPQSEDLRKNVTNLADVYATRRVSVIELIFNKPTAKMQSFADAFKLKEDK